MKRRLQILTEQNVKFDEAFQKFLELLKSLTVWDENAESEKFKELTFSITLNLYLDRKKLLLEPFSVFGALLKIMSAPYGGARRDIHRKNGIRLESPINNQGLICLEDLWRLQERKTCKKQNKQIIEEIVDYCLIH